MTKVTAIRQYYIKLLFSREIGEAVWDKMKC